MEVGNHLQWWWCQSSSRKKEQQRIIPSRIGFFYFLHWTNSCLFFLVNYPSWHLNNQLYLRTSFRWNFRDTLSKWKFDILIGWRHLRWISINLHLEKESFLHKSSTKVNQSFENLLFILANSSRVNERFLPREEYRCWYALTFTEKEKNLTRRLCVRVFQNNDSCVYKGIKSSLTDWIEYAWNWIGIFCSMMTSIWICSDIEINDKRWREWSHQSFCREVIEFDVMIYMENHSWMQMIDWSEGFFFLVVI